MRKIILSSLILLIPISVFFLCDKASRREMAMFVVSEANAAGESGPHAQYDRFHSILVNPGFENGTFRWTNAGSGSFFTTTTASDVGVGAAAASWDAAAASDTLTSGQVPTPAGVYGQLCRAEFLYKGGDSNITAQVIDGTPSVIGSLVLSTASTYTTGKINFACPTSGTIAFRLGASANAAVIFLDSIYIGLGQLTTLSGSETLTNKILFRDTVDDWIDFNGESGTPAPPAVGQVRVYSRLIGSDYEMFFENSDGVETALGSAGALSNPMNSAGDMITATTGGAAINLESGTSGQFLMATGASSPVWTSPIPLASGGTNGTDAAVNGGLVYSDADSMEISSAGTSQQWVLSGGAGAPTMSNTTTTGKFIDGTANENQLLIQGHSTQTNDVFVVETSAGADALRVVGVGGTGGSHATIRGTGTSNDADAGFVGEYFQNQTTLAAGSTATNNVFADYAGGGIALTAGDWDIRVQGCFGSNGGAVTGTQFVIAIGTAAGNSSAGIDDFNLSSTPTVPTAASDICMSVVPYRVSLSGSQTYYGKIRARFTAGTVVFYGRISARRVR